MQKIPHAKHSNWAVWDATYTMSGSVKALAEDTKLKKKIVCGVGECGTHSGQYKMAHKKGRWLNIQNSKRILSDLNMLHFG